MLKTYTVGEMINAMKIGKMAYAFQGGVKGAFIIVDTDNNNRLTTIYDDGIVSDKMIIRCDTEITPEEGKQWILVDELFAEEGNEELKNEVRTLFVKHLTTMIQQRTEEEKSNEETNE